MDRDLLMAAATVKAWTREMSRPIGDTAEGASRLRGVLTEICDVAMPRIRRPPPRRQVYWWTPELAELREQCNLARRRYTRCRRRREIETVAAPLREAWKEKKASLQRAIKKAKAMAWEDLCASIDKDPWGRPYKIVKKKLTAGGPPITETLPPQTLGKIISTLFPDSGEGRNCPGRPPDRELAPWSMDELGVTEEELRGITKKLRAKNTAPGPDGISAKALALAAEVLGDGLRHLFNRCLEEGRFPSCWKVGRVVLLHKEGKPAGSPSAYRPICLLDEAGKLLERIIAARLRQHLSRVGPDLADCQYGFREGRSTIDAIKRVRALSDTAVSQGRVVLAMSLDIANAFNSLPWEHIRGALEHHRVPQYMQSVIRDYLRDRRIEYPGRYGVIHRRETNRGVPQGSVLGPLLWNLGYDWVLRGALLPGMAIVCYADDTLVMAWEKDWRSTILLAQAGVAHVIGRIRALGLEVALQKTEAIWFAGPRSRGPPRDRAVLEIEGERVGIGTQMKYLGLILDHCWSFGPHFDRLAPRIRAAAANLGRLMPNLGGPRDGARRLFMGAVRSIALYGAPVWHDQLEVTRRCKQVLRDVHRRMALRVARGYRTVSYEAACVVSGSLPWELAAGMYTEMYNIRAARRLQREQADLPAHTGRVETRQETLLRQRTFEEWQEALAHTRKDLRAVGAIRPVLKDWVGRRFGALGFRLVQVLTGHGCFGEYLHKIGKEPTTKFHHCDSPSDSAEHTLVECQAWEANRRVLLGAIGGGDVSLPTVVHAMVGREEVWRAVASFCEDVMSQKEVAEREREEDRRAPPSRRRRGGVAGRTYARLDITPP